MMLSQFLNRETYSYRVSTPSKTEKNHKKITLFQDQDRHTIISKEN